MATTDIGPKNPAIKAGEAVVDYVDRRSGVSTGFKWFMFRNVPAETSWFQTLGFTAMALFGMQAVTGIILAMYYQPSPDTAYQSIDAITHDVTWGWLVRGMHKWGASAMIVVVFLHLGRVFFFGSYKYPRELTWVTGAILLIMTMFMGLTGYLLVWDQKAYWATVVAVNITASAPIIGPYIADILRAGPEFGPDTLSRFYSIHMLVIPGGIATFIGLHLYLITKLGIAEPPHSHRRQAVEREEEEARRHAERERLPYGRREVPVTAPAPVTAPTATQMKAEGRS
jgi:menaquinol-cytochrome c reductase cytochrome b subunit